MTPGGEFVSAAPRSMWPLRIGVGAALVAAIAGVLAIAAVFLWIASILVPIALVAAVIAYVAFRLQGWRANASGRPLQTRPWER